MSQVYGAWRARVQRGVTALLLALALPAMMAHAAQPSPVRKVLVMGDSLSAAYGLAPAQGWVALTDERLKARHPGWRMANASISGETTAGGASRIAGELARHKPAVVVIELGANDGLRGLPLAQTRANLERMVVASKQAGARVLLVGMRMPPNFGAQYTQGFERNYSDLAKLHGTALLPFLLEPIATERSAFQSDNLHPVAEAQPKLRDHVWPALAPLLR
ncbi:MAG: arylesterase [Arenimonas sp.]|uniref:arylesterase n=1 Tax=Arenimonas sp. TaxID=1872635 RepID=UPI0025C58346|nr:arylesterase [Arenimonas sp.]MBW8366877.1 arylesterase [Arenimonas sp.]